MKRLTEEKQIGPFASLKDKAEAVPGAFVTYDCLYAHMVAVTCLKEYEDTGLSPEKVSDLLERFSYFYRTVEGLDLVDPVHFGAFVDRVMRWQQAEKDGRLVVLPCKVGDTVYVTYGEGQKPCVVDRIHIIANGQVQVRMRHFCTETLWLSASEFGKTVFLTREEAVTALNRKKADNEKSDSDIL